MPTIIKSIFGYIHDKPVDLYTISNKNGMTCKISNYGCIITSISMPDKNGDSSEVVLGFDDLDSYLAGHPYFGAIVGRIANRISHSSFSLEGTRYDLHTNNGAHHLHGGLEGFDKKIWASEIIEKEDYTQIIMQYLSPDGEENYPGNLSCKVTFTFHEENVIEISYECTSDKTTIVNLTHHDYFNLKDGGIGSALDHELRINADSYTPTDDEVCPKGTIEPVANSHYDFRDFKNIEEKIIEKDGVLKPGQGYDINYVVNHNYNKPAATLRDPHTRRQLDIYSDQPCLQLYTSGHLDGSLSRDGQQFIAYSGICLESQSYPDAINQSGFPSVVLKPGEVYEYRTIYRFEVY